MSAIPPPGHAGLIQAHEAARRAAEAKATEESAEAKRASKDAFADRLREVIGSEDRDSQVYADAEGAGSQGKAFDEAPDEEQDQDAAAAADDEPDAPGGIDLTA